MKIMSPLERKCPTACGQRVLCEETTHKLCFYRRDICAFKQERVRFGNTAIQNERWWLTGQEGAELHRNGDLPHLKRCVSLQQLQHVLTCWVPVDHRLRGQDLRDTSELQPTRKSFLGGRGVSPVCRSHQLGVALRPLQLHWGLFPQSQKPFPSSFMVQEGRHSSSLCSNMRSLVESKSHISTFVVCLITFQDIRVKFKEMAEHTAWRLLDSEQ